MKTTVEEVSSTMKKLIVEIDESEVAKKLDEAFLSVSRNVKVPGFRPGKAPRSLLETRFGQQVREDVSRSLVGDTLPAAISEAGITPLGYPEIEKEMPAKGKPFTYSASMEIRPSFEVEHYKGVEVEKEKVEISDEKVQERLEAILKSRGELRPAEEGKKIADGDYVTLHYQAFDGGEPIEDMSADNFTVHVGSGDFHPLFESSLLGLEKEAEKDIEVDFEETHHHSKLAGKHVRFHVRVLDINTIDLPDLDDDFARGLGADFADLEDLKNKLRESMLRESEQRAGQKVRRKLIEKICSTVDFDVPNILVESELNYAIQSVRQNLARSGSSLEKAGLSEEKLREEFRPASEKRAREMLVLGQIAAQENLRIEGSDLDDAFNSMSAATSQPVGVLRRYHEDQGLMGNLEEKLLEEKTLKYLLENANLTEAGKVDN